MKGMISIKEKITIILLLITITVFTGCDIGSNSIENKNNIEAKNEEQTINNSKESMTVEVTYGNDNLTPEGIIKEMKKINEKYPKDQTIEVDGYKISERDIYMAMLGGRTKEEAIQWKLKPIKRGEALRKILTKFDDVIPSDEEVEEHKKYITSISSEISGDDLEMFLLTTGYLSYEEYVNAPETFDAAKHLLIYSNIFERLVEDEKKLNSNITIQQAEVNAKSKLEDLILQEMDKH